jgi:hypothetical protein
MNAPSEMRPVCSGLKGLAGSYTAGSREWRMMEWRMGSRGSIYHTFLRFWSPRK